MMADPLVMLKGHGWSDDEAGLGVAYSWWRCSYDRRLYMFSHYVEGFAHSVGRCVVDDFGNLVATVTRHYELEA